LGKERKEFASFWQFQRRGEEASVQRRVLRKEKGADHSNEKSRQMEEGGGTKKARPSSTELVSGEGNHNPDKSQLTLCIKRGKKNQVTNVK